MATRSGAGRGDSGCAAALAPTDPRPHDLQTLGPPYGNLAPMRRTWLGWKPRTPSHFLPGWATSINSGVSRGEPRSPWLPACSAKPSWTHRPTPADGCPGGAPGPRLQSHVAPLLPSTEPSGAQRRALTLGQLSVSYNDASRAGAVCARLPS